MTRVPRTALAALALALAALPAGADMLQLRDGRFVDGVPMKVDGQSIVLSYKNGDVRLPLADVEDYFIEGAAPPEPANDEDRAKLAAGLVRWKGKWVKPDVRDKAVKAQTEARRRELEDARKRSEWRNRYKFASKNFDFESTLPPSLNEHYSGLLDAYFDVFRKEWGITVPKDWGKLKVCFYPDRESFAKIGGAGGGTLAYYRFVPPRELNFFNERRDPRMTETVMFHECNHYLVDLFSQGLRYPHWVGEAMAEYYGASTYDPKTKAVKFGQVQEGRLAEVHSDVDSGRWFTLKELIEQNPHYEDYYWGWSFTHFLMSSPQYQKKYRKFFVDLARAGDVKRVSRGDGSGFSDVSNEESLRVFKDRMGLKDLGPLEKEWHDYVKNLQAPGVRGYEEAGKRAFSEGRWKFRAPRLLKEAVDKGSRDVETILAYARCLRTKQEHDESLAMIDKAIALDPLDADLYAEKGYVLQAKGDKEAGRKFVELAREMNPDGRYPEIVVPADPSGGGDGD